MRMHIRFAAMSPFAFALALVLSISTTLAAALAATSMIMGGKGHPLSVPEDTSTYINSFVSGANGGYIEPSGLCVGGSPGCTLLAVYTPEEFRFDTGLKDMTFDESVAVGHVNLDDCIRGAVCTVTPAPYIATIDEALDDTTYVVYGYSQSATIATIQKRNLIDNPAPGTQICFILNANPNRPHGGVLATFPACTPPSSE